MYQSYQAYIRLYFELYTGVKVVFHGDMVTDETARARTYLIGFRLPRRVLQGEIDSSSVQFSSLS